MRAMPASSGDVLIACHPRARVWCAFCCCACGCEGINALLCVSLRDSPPAQMDVSRSRMIESEKIV